MPPDTLLPSWLRHPAITRGQEDDVPQTQAGASAEQTDASRRSPVNPMALSPDELRPLEDTAGQAADCTRCALSEGRTKVVFGSGNATADLMIVGDGPGRHEDLQGSPFVGALGNLLDNTLADAELTREDCYLTHIVKCRAPDGREADAEEVASCVPYLVEQIAHVRPEVIVAMGAFAAQVVLRRPVPIAKVAGYRLDVFDGVTLIPTHHPASALRGNPSAVAALKRDLRSARAVIEGDLPTGAETVEIARQQADRT